MKKFVLILLLFFIFLGTFSEAAEPQLKDLFWKNPKYIKTYIPQGHKRTLMMQHALEEWTRKTNKNIIFKYVQSQNTAQIKIHFVDSIPNAERGQIGLTQYRYLAKGKLIKADVYIAERRPQGGQLNNDAVYTVMLHEIGHALGMVEHSTNPMSLMFPTEDDRQEIQPEDIKRLQRLYKW